MFSPSNKIILTIVAILLVVLVVWILIGLRVEKSRNIISNDGLSETEEAKAQAGSEGEVFVLNESTGEEVPLKTGTMQPDLFSAAGVIKEVLSNGLIVYTDGYTFADETPREVSVIFNDSTIVMSSDRQVRWVGSSGLYHLTPDIQIVISSDENIRGKLKYEAKYINILP
ncbi:MAG: hypothetical protein PHC43_10125 [Candidatus Marinimicrobia bacterium]|nr:hypothetical protein [Candidatus Neomarinimicrobiota bacterium]